MESPSGQALQKGGLWVQKGKNVVQLSTHFYCQDVEGTGGLMLLEDLLGEVLRLQMDSQLKSLHHLERGQGSCFIEGTHKNVICSLDLGELVSLDDECSGRD